MNWDRSVFFLNTEEFGGRQSRVNYDSPIRSSGMGMQDRALAPFVVPLTLNPYQDPRQGSGFGILNVFHINNFIKLAEAVYIFGEADYGRFIFCLLVLRPAVFSWFTFLVYPAILRIQCYTSFWSICYTYQFFCVQTEDCPRAFKCW